MNIKTLQQAKAIKDRASRIAKSRTKRINKRRLDADERKFLSQFKEIWE